MDIKDETNRCLDEIEAAYEIILKRGNDQEAVLKCKSCVRQHKAILKEIGYKGKTPRQPKLTKQRKAKAGEESEKSLFDDE